MFDSRSSTPSRHLQRIQCARFASPQTVSQGPSQGLQLLPSCHYTEVVTMTQSFEISVVTAEGSRARDSDFQGTILSTLLTMCLSKLTLRLAFHTCSCEVLLTCPSVHVLQADMCKSTCHRRSALSTHPTLPPRTDRLQGFPRPVIIVDISVFIPSDSGMGENTSSGRSCRLSLALMISRHTNIERHISPFILSTHFNLGGLQVCNRCRSTSFHQQLQTHPASSCISFLVSVLHSTTSGQSMCRLSVFLRTLSGNHLYPAPDLQNAIHQL